MPFTLITVKFLGDLNEYLWISLKIFTVFFFFLEKYGRLSTEFKTKLRKVVRVTAFKTQGLLQFSNTLIIPEKKNYFFIRQLLFEYLFSFSVRRKGGQRVKTLLKWPIRDVKPFVSQSKNRRFDQNALPFLDWFMIWRNTCHLYLYRLLWLSHLLIKSTSLCVTE